MLRLKQFLTLLCLLVGTALFAQNRVITGKVLSGKDNSAISGASIIIKGSANSGTTTGTDGSFSLSVPGGATTISVSSIGFVLQDVNVQAGQNSVSVVLVEDTKQLGEVVVTALGITRQSKTLVYATQTIKPAQLTEVRDPNNVLNSLSGKIANAVVTQGSGGPGSGARIVLRGNRSIQGSNNALIVVDGVPITNDTYGTAGSDFGSVQGSDGASNINPDDIESVTVLRGASAAALYGSAAGNGVIVITTKKGTRDRVSVTVNSGVQFEQAYALPKVQNSYGQGNGGVFDRKSGESWGPKIDGHALDSNYLGNPDVYTSQPDNIKDFFRTGVSFNNSIGVAAGGDKVQTYLSYTNNNIQGIVPGNDLIRNTVNLRLSTQLNSKWSTDAKLTYMQQDIKNRPRTGEENAPTIDIYNIPRNVSLTNAKNYDFVNVLGVSTPTYWPSTLASIYQNPYWMIHRTGINESRDRLQGFVSLKYNITDWLNVTGRANLDRINTKLDQYYYQGTILWASQPGGYYSKTNIQTTQKWADLIFEGTNKLTDDLKLNYHAGAIFFDYLYEDNTGTANGLNVTNKFSLNFASNPELNQNSTEIQTQSLFGQASLSWKDKIFLDASLRNDWDSRLPKPYSYPYYSVGVSAIISDMVKLPENWSYLKANINYAEVGNGGQAQILTSKYTYSQGAGNGFLQRSSTLPIPGLKPEIVKNLEIGVESRFINNRIGFTATFYKSNSFNQLLLVPLPPASGYANQYINAGNIQNEGFEFVLNGTVIKNKDFNWDVTLNFALNRNKVISLSNDLKTVYLSGGYGRSGTPVVKEGGSYGDLLAYQWARDPKGNFLVTAAGKPLTTDILKEDQGLIGNFNPKETFGFTNIFNYKAFSLRILIDGRIGGTVISGTEMNLAFSGIPEATGQYRDGGWALGGVDTTGAAVGKTISAQDFWQTASGKRYGVGEFFAYDMTNFRIRELSISYDIPMKSNKIIKGARISAMARNVAWLYRGSSLLDIPGLGKRKMWFDPDMSLGNGNFQGVEYGTLPATRSWGFNLKLTF